MKAVLLKNHGGPEVMTVGEIDTPQPGPGQVRIRVMATSVNRADIVQREGNYPPPPGDSEILGLEATGIVDAVGEGVSNWRTGDRVMSLVAGGGYAEYALAHADHLLRVPEQMPFEVAACACETYITAYLNIFMLGGLQNGQTVLIHGGGGGVGTAAIQLCRALTPDSTLFITASTAKVDRVRALGAHRVIDYTSASFAEEIRAQTANQGVDLILDHIGAGYLQPNLKALARGGTLVVIGVMGGAQARINLAHLMVKRQRIIGSTLRSRSVAEKKQIIQRFTDTVIPLFHQGRLAPLRHTVLPMHKIAEAHRMMEASRHFGKIVVMIRDL